MKHNNIFWVRVKRKWPQIQDSPLIYKTILKCQNINIVKEKKNYFDVVVTAVS